MFARLKNHHHIKKPCTVLYKIIDYWLLITMIQFPIPISHSPQQFRWSMIDECFCFCFFFLFILLQSINQTFVVFFSLKTKVEICLYPTSMMQVVMMFKSIVVCDGNDQWINEKKEHQTSGRLFIALVTHQQSSPL